MKPLDNPKRPQLGYGNDLIFQAIKLSDWGFSLNHSADNKVIFWQDENHEYGLCLDFGARVSAGIVKVLLEKSFTQYKVPLLGRGNEDTITILEDDQFQDFYGIDGIIALAQPPFYALYNGKMERDLKEILEWIQEHKESLQTEHNEIYLGTAHAAYAHVNDREELVFENKTSQIVFQYGKALKINPLNLLPATIGLEQKLLSTLGPDGHWSDIKRLALDMTLLQELLPYYANYENSCNVLLRKPIPTALAHQTAQSAG